MSTPILTTKLYIPPPRPDLVPRPRLIERLNEGLSRKLTLLSAPAGFGKTMLIAEWLSDLNLPALDFGLDTVNQDQIRNSHPVLSKVEGVKIENRVAWLSLNDDDNDPVRFFIYLTAALETVQADVGADAQSLLQSPQPPPLKAAVTMLINELSTMPAHLVLVLDDYHVIEQRSIHEALTFLLDHMPPQMHLVIASRVDPPLPLARLRSRNQLAELRAVDLRFTADETITFLNQAMGLDLSPEDVATLETRTEGWIAGLQMAALSMQGKVSDDVADFIGDFSGNHRHVIDFLAEEVLAQQSDEIHDFLCHTSILDRLTTSLCNMVTGRDDSDAILKKLEQANLFLIPLDDQRQWYRYHRLFADFLRSHLHQDMPDQVSVLHRRASEWYEQQGFLAAAIDHALSGADFERAAYLIEEAADTILMHSEIATLQGWIETLPDNVVRTRPLLCIYHAVTLVLSGNPLESASSRLRNAIEADTAGLASGEVVAFQAWVAALQGNTDQTIELSQQALELLPENSLFLRTLVAASVGLAYLWSGDVVPAFQAFSEVARIGQKSGNVMLAVIALRRLADIRTIQGQLKQARAFYEEALELAVDGRGRPRPIAGLALIGLGWLLLEWNDLEEAMCHLTEGIELTNKWSDVASLHGYIGLACARQAQGDVAGANQAIQKARQVAAKFDATEMDDILVGAYQARLWVAQDDYEAALGWVEERGLVLSEVEGNHGDVALSETDEAAGNRPISFFRLFEYIPLARLYIAQKRFDMALAVLRPLLRAAESAGWMWFGIEIMILQAVAYQYQGGTDQALTVLERVLSVAEPEGFMRIFIDNGPPMSKLLRQAATRGIAVDYVGQLVAAFPDYGLTASSTRDSPQSKIRNLKFEGVDPLSERELEILRLVAIGLSNQAIAEELVIATSTVKTHINNIYRKLDVSSRTQAVACARELNLV